MKKFITHSLLTAGLTFTLSACGDKKEDASGDGKTGNNSNSKGNNVANENSESELKAKLSEALVKEMFGEVKDLQSHYSADMGFPLLTLQFESGGEYFSLSITKGKNSNGNTTLDALSKRYTDGEFVKGIGDRAYLNRKLKNISVVKDGALYHISCVKRVSLDEERTKILAKKLIAK